MKGCATSRTGWAASRRAANLDDVGEAASVLVQAHALILLRKGRQVGEVARIVGDDRDEGVPAALALLGDHPVEGHAHLGRTQLRAPSRVRSRPNDVEWPAMATSS